MPLKIKSSLEDIESWGNEVEVFGEDVYNYWEKQIIAYAKGHYGFINFSYEFLKYFAAKMYDLRHEDVCKHNVNNMVFNLHHKMNISKDLESFIETVFKRNDYGKISYDDVLYSLLSDVQGAETNGVLSGVLPDSELLLELRSVQ